MNISREKVTKSQHFADVPNRTSSLPAETSASTALSPFRNLTPVSPFSIFGGLGRRKGGTGWRLRIHPPPLRFAEVQNQSKSNHFPFAKSVENGDFMLTDIRDITGLLWVNRAKYLLHTALLIFPESWLSGRPNEMEIENCSTRRKIEVLPPSQQEKCNFIVVASSKSRSPPPFPRSCGREKRPEIMYFPSCIELKRQPPLGCVKLPWTTGVG